MYIASFLSSMFKLAYVYLLQVCFSADDVFSYLVWLLRSWRLHQVNQVPDGEAKELPIREATQEQVESHDTGLVHRYLSGMFTIQRI